MAKDLPGSGARRLKERPGHLARAQVAYKEGTVVSGGALLDSDRDDASMTGSLMILECASLEECKAFIKQDPYVSGNVWDMSKLQIMPYKPAKRE